MSSIRTSDEFFKLAAAARDERATVIAAERAAKRLIENATEEAHAKTVLAAKALLSAGGSEYMIGQATGMTGYHQRRRLAEEARGATASITLDDAVFANSEPSDGVDTNWTVEEIDTGKFVVRYVADTADESSLTNYYLDLFEGDFYNGASPLSGDVVDSVGALTELGIFEEVSRAIRG